MYYGIGYQMEVASDGMPPDESTGWWERICGPQTNVYACARALGKFLVTSTPKNPRSGWAMQRYFIVRGEDLPHYGLPIPSKDIEQPAFIDDGGLA